MEDIMKKSMVIYLLTDRTNGLKYVGQTTRTLGKRMQAHRTAQRTYIDRAIKDHGWKNFTVEILDECSTPAELDEREIFWIATLGTKFPNGYNMTDGGEGCSGYKVSQQSRRRMSLAHNPRHIVCVETGRVFDSADEAAAWAGVTKSSIFRACNGIARSAGGYHWFYQETPELAKHEVKVVEQKNKRAVRCVETGQIFDSIKEAAAWAGVHPTVIIRVCDKVKGKHTAGGFHWEYVEEKAPKIPNVGRKKRAVLCVETGEVFESLCAAAKWAGCRVSSIMRVCNGERKTCRGYHWRYVDEYEAARA